MASLKKLVGQTALYGISSIVGRAVNFLLVPFYTAKGVLSVSEFGVMTEFYAFVAFLNIIYAFGMETAYFRFANKSDESESFNNGFTFLLLINLCLSGILFLFSAHIATFIGYDGYGEYIQWLSLVLLLDGIFSISFARLRQQGKSIQFVAIRLSNIFLNIGFNMFFLVGCPMALKGFFGDQILVLVSSFYDPNWQLGYVFLSNFLANLLFVPTLLNTLRGYTPKLSKEFMKPMFWYAMPLVFVGLAGMVNEVVDRVLLRVMIPDGMYPGYTNQYVVGIYGACYKLSMFVSLANQAFRYAAEPFFFSLSEDKKAPSTYSKVMHGYILFTLIVVVIISLFRNEFALLLLSQKAYHTGLFIVPILLFANLFLGIYYNQSIWYKVSDKTKYGTIISVFGAFITIGLNVLLIPIIGYLGSAITTLVCYFAMCVLSFYWGQKYYPVPYKVGRASFYLIIATGIVLISYLPFFEVFLIRIGVSLCMVLLFVALIWKKEKDILLSKS